MASTQTLQLSDEMLLRRGGSAHCRVCGFLFAPDVAADRAAHRQIHNKLAGGALPAAIREFVKRFGWAVAHADHSLGTFDEEFDKETGLLAVAFSWWSRALFSGVDPADFDEFMLAHIRYARALTDPSEDIDTASTAIKRWEVYAG